jgi:hypothetical protein
MPSPVLWQSRQIRWPEFLAAALPALSRQHLETVAIAHLRSGERHVHLAQAPLEREVGHERAGDAAGEAALRVAVLHTIA